MYVYLFLASVLLLVIGSIVADLRTGNPDVAELTRVCLTPRVRPTVPTVQVADWPTHEPRYIGSPALTMSAPVQEAMWAALSTQDAAPFVVLPRSPFGCSGIACDEL